MSLDMFRAVVDGYSDHIFDLQVVAVQQGYWSGYYNRAKKPKGIDAIVKKLFNSKEKGSSKSKRPKQKKADDVDVEAFLAMERRRLGKS